MTKIDETVGNLDNIKPRLLSRVVYVIHVMIHHLVISPVLRSDLENSHGVGRAGNSPRAVEWTAGHKERPPS